MGIYNAFTFDGNPSNIVIPIPNTNQSITINPSSTKTFLHNNNGDFIITFIELWWGYIFCVYVIKDLSTKIEKIQSGDIENIQTTNVKKEML